jgi:ectoine hydroxylase-related dioxygenase (phytanoyl-CoA dioxygenase family)
MTQEHPFPGAADGNATALERDGFVWVRNVLGAVERQDLLKALGDPAGAGSRGLLGLPAVREWAQSKTLASLVSAHLGPSARPVRAIFFDKSATSNWLVPWHQDVTLAVARPVEAPGFGPWSLKDGIPHVQAPGEWLSRMLTVRLHLDDCDASNGALRVIPGSHRHGRLESAQIPAIREATAELLCTALAGDALLMRPLLLHGSSKSMSRSRRRILHLEYCSGTLPAGMEWHDAA